MAERIDRALIQHVAQLSSLSLSDAEADTLTQELAAIVAYVGELETLDTSDVPATAHVQIERTALRADVVEPGVTHEEALSQASRVADGGFAVPPFVDSGGGE